MAEARGPLRVINAVAPIRICDNGGWTDTWFARYGQVFNIAVYPYVEAQIRVYKRSDDSPRILIQAENYGETWTIAHPTTSFSKHPLLEAAFTAIGVPDDVSIEVSIYSEAPAGCSTGTSASVSVALIGSLDALTPGRMTPHEVARAAHRIETDMLGQQCGIQDQIAAAYGGISFIDMHEYPWASVSPIHVPDPVWWELESRLALIFVGQTHSSSDVHKTVIRGLEDAGPEDRRLNRLRASAAAARDAVYAADFAALGRSMAECTEAQRHLHASLIGPRHQQIIDIARENGAVGWKVNGAGGEGGSVTILTGADRRQRRTMLREIAEANAEYRNLPVFLSRMGLRTWSTPATGC